MHRQFMAAYRFVLLGNLSFLLVLQSGCGDALGRVPVQGQVTLNGEPLEEGKIVFTPLGDGPSAGGNIAQGAYSIGADGGPAVGTYQVEIYSYREAGQTIDDPVDGSWETQENIVPAKYNEDSELTVEVAHGDQSSLDFELLSQ